MPLGVSSSSRLCSSVCGCVLFQSYSTFGSQGKILFYIVMIKACHKHNVLQSTVATEVNSSCLGHVTECSQRREQAISWLISLNIALIEDSVPARHVSLKQTHAHICTCLHAWINVIYNMTFMQTHTFLTSIPIHLLFTCCLPLPCCHFCTSPSSCGKPKSLMQQCRKPVSIFDAILIT